MNALFVNAYGEQACGVHQFGRNLYAILKDSNKITWSYCEPQTEGNLMAVALACLPDWILFNWSSVMGGWLNEAPFSWLKQQALVFHDGQVNDRFNAVFFSDPTSQLEGKWHVLGRPIPYVNPLLYANRPKNSQLTIGCHGFLGAWADEVVKRVMQEFEGARIRLQLPYSIYCDPDGTQARSMADRCREMTRNSATKLMVNHNFLNQAQLLDWLGANDLNCYIRPLNPWRGVSSAPDAALAVNKPIAVNCCSAFRHLHNLKPSIVVDQSSLMEILGNGLAPLIAFKQQWCDPEIIRNQVESVLLAISAQ